MGFDSQKRSAQATTQQRDSSGHFITSKTAKSSDTEGADILHDLVKTEKESDDSALIDVKLNNPFHKISLLLQDIKKHQGTTFDFKFTIPILALPIVLLAAFQLGKINTSCLETFTAKTGTVHILSVMAPKDESPTIWQTVLTFVPGVSQPTAKKDLVSEDEAVLLTDEGNSITIVTNYLSSLKKYDNQYVIISGNASECTNTITLDDKDNVEGL